MGGREGESWKHGVSSGKHDFPCVEREVMRSLILLSGTVILDRLGGSGEAKCCCLVVLNVL